MKKTNKKGFTLAELLVVVAIIAVLVAIAIPIFTSQLEKAKEATDEANIRAAYAEVVTDKLTNGNDDAKKTVTLTQGSDGWTETPKWPENVEEVGTPSAGGTATVTMGTNAKGDEVATITYAAK